MRMKHGVGDLIIKPQVVMPKKLNSPKNSSTLKSLEKKDNFKI